MRWKRFIHDRALISLSKKAVTAYKGASEACGVPAVPSMERLEAGEAEATWYVNEDVDYFMEKR